MWAGDFPVRGAKKQARQNQAAIDKRVGGIGKAVDRLTKEGVEEGSAGEELKAIDGDYYEDSTDFFSMFDQDHFDREEESADGMEIRGYIDDHCVMVFKYSTPDMMGGWGIYDDSALIAESGVEDDEEEGETCPECDGAGCPECYGEEDRDRAHDHAQGMERESAGMAEGAGGSSPTKVMKKYLPRSMWDPILSHTGKSKHSNADGSKTSHVWRLRNLVRSFQGREFDAWKQAVEQELGSGYKVTSEWPTPSVRYIQMNNVSEQQGMAEAPRDREDDERHDLDPSDWYIVKDGKLLKASIYPNQHDQARAEGFSPTREQARARAANKGMEEGMIGNAYNTLRAMNYDRLANRPSTSTSQHHVSQEREQKAADIRRAVADKKSLEKFGGSMKDLKDYYGDETVNIRANYKESEVQQDMTEIWSGKDDDDKVDAINAANPPKRSTPYTPPSTPAKHHTYDRNKAVASNISGKDSAAYDRFTGRDKEMDETADNVKYGVFAKGGSVGSQRFRDDPLKTFDTREEAVRDARRRRSSLSPGERGYYRMGYVVKPIKGEVDEGMIDSIKNTVRAANYDRLARRSNSQAVAGGGFAPPAQFKSLSAKGDQRAQKAQDIRKGSAEQVDEIDMGLVGDAVAGAAMGLGSVGLGSYIGHKIGNKIGQKFIDRSNRKEAEAGRKEAEAGSEKMQAIEKARAARIAANKAYRDHENLHGYELAQDHPEYQNRVNLGNKKFRNMDVPSAFDEEQQVDEKSEAVRHGNNNPSIYHVDESVDPVEQLRADIRRFAQ
jgi:hypothetical protein